MPKGPDLTLPPVAPINDARCYQHFGLDYHRVPSWRVNVECPSCGSANQDENRFCGDCGASLAQHCRACGRENPPGKKFCGDCGAPLTNACSSERPSTATPGSPASAGA